MALRMERLSERQIAKKTTMQQKFSRPRHRKVEEAYMYDDMKKIG